MSQLRDTDIIQFLQSGESKKQETAFRFLYREYFGLIESLIMTNKGTKDDAADIFHDGLIVLFNSLKKGDFQLKSTVKTYLYSICRNLWLMKLRKGKKEVALDENHKIIPIHDDQFKTLETNERKGLLVQLLKELNEDCRKILELFYFRKLKMDQIKGILNLASEQVAKNKKSRCMKNIRAKVKESTLYSGGLR